MKNILIFLFLVTISACNTTSILNIDEQQNVSKIVFKKSIEINKYLESFSAKLKDSLMQCYKQENNTDTIPDIIFNTPTFSDVIKATPETEIVIEISKDTIWKYIKQDNKMIGDFQRLAFHENKIYYHAKIDKNLMYKSIDLGNVFSNFSVEKYPKDRKIIFGYDCYKVIVKEIMNYEHEFDLMGMTETNLYEMYVTNRIKIPISTIFQTLRGNDFDFFPLLVNVKNNLGVSDRYEATEIK